MQQTPQNATNQGQSHQQQQQYSMVQPQGGTNLSLNVNNLNNVQIFNSAPHHMMGMTGAQAHAMPPQMHM